MMIIRAILLFLGMSLSHLLSAQDYSILSSKDNYPIYISFNNNENAFTGIPVEFDHYIKIPSSTKDTAFVIRQLDGTQIQMNKIQDSIAFVFSNKTMKIEGHLYIPSVRLRNYQGAFDIETFETVADLEEYYIPLRSGTWTYTINGQVLTKNHHTRFEPKASRDYVYHQYKGTYPIDYLKKNLKDTGDTYALAYADDFWGLYRTKDDKFSTITLTNHTINLITYLKESPRVQLEIGVQTDCRGSETFNLALTRQRAKQLRRFLIQQGVRPKQLQVKGLGEVEPVCPRDCEDFGEVFIKCGSSELMLDNRVVYRVVRMD